MHVIGLNIIKIYSKIFFFFYNLKIFIYDKKMDLLDTEIYICTVDVLKAFDQNIELKHFK